MSGLIGSAMFGGDAKVASLIDDIRIVINRGSNSGVSIGDRYLIYSIGQEILDPDTKQSLGRIEIVKGRGEVIHVQENISIIQTTEKVEVQRSIFSSAFEISSKPKGFIDPQVGDLARPIGKALTGLLNVKP